MSQAVATKMYWWEDDNEEIPAERVWDNKEKARKFAGARSKDIKGRIELSYGPQLPPFAVYKCGVDVQQVSVNIMNPDGVIEQISV